ncbi:alpha/beta hydrolase [Coleofasciculus sp. FACHB-501]|uniref:alpha/beta hydrolase n=1 Tax=Cyanophyceae TaxID=3028117 RepID=UPI0016870B26|nr:alpha/beta hydrolase [Coleofasciculus sp. FACHB-501]MBD1837317.1 alpha/beta hydrolase [Coleofasciculus sp. FACHB-501]
MDKKKLKRLLFGEFSLKRLMRSAIFIYAFLCFYAYFFSDRMIFLPQPSSYRDSSEILKLTTADGVQISAAYLPNPDATYTILYSHGNAEDLFDVLSVRQGLRDMGFAVFAYDYRGYGTSQGTPTERNSYRDIDAAYTYLTQQLGVPPNRIIAYGRSVGSGPAVDLASRQPLAGLIVESAFVTAFRVLTRIPIVPFDRFRNLDKIKKVRCPVLVMHGRRDEVIPFWHGEQLFAAANEPKRFLWVDRAGHNDFSWVAAQQSEKAVREFAQLVEQFQRNLPRG